MEYDSVVLKSLGLEEGYQRYYFLGKNIEISKEVIEECGKDNFFELTNGDDSFVFVKSDYYTTSDAASEYAPLLSREMNWDDPMFIICIERGEWVIKPTTEGEKYLE